MLSSPLLSSDGSNSKSRKKRPNSSHKPEFFHGEPFRPDYIYDMLLKIRSTLSYKVPISSPALTMWSLYSSAQSSHNCVHQFCFHTRQSSCLGGQRITIPCCLKFEIRMYLYSALLLLQKHYLTLYHSQQQPF